MKKALITAVLCTGLTAPAVASEWVIGASLGVLRPGGEHSDSTPAIAGSASLALEFLNLGVADIGATFEYTKGLSQAKLDNQDADVSARALWLSARTLGPLYVIARTGLVELELSPVVGGLSGERDPALSVGVGFSLGLRTELIYTRVDHDAGDATQWVSLMWGF